MVVDQFGSVGLIATEPELLPQLAPPGALEEGHKVIATAALTGADVKVAHKLDAGATAGVAEEPLQSGVGRVGFGVVGAFDVEARVLGGQSWCWVTRPDNGIIQFVVVVIIIVVFVVIIVIIIIVVIIIIFIFISCCSGGGCS